MLTRVLCLFAVCGVVWGCGKSPQQGGALVRVGDEEIGELELREYYSSLAEYLRPKTSGEEAVRDLLRSMVIGRLLVMAAEEQGYAEEPELQEDVHSACVRKLVGEVSSREVRPRVQLNEEDVVRHYHEDHWDEVHRPAHILSASEEDAWEVVAELKRGRDFAEVAKERSLADDAEIGGDLRQYFGPADVVPELGEAVLGLAAGAFTDPVRTRDGWEVIKVLDVRPMPLERVRARLSQGLYRKALRDQRVAQGLYRKALRDQRVAYIRELEDRYAVRYYGAGVSQLIRHAEEPYEGVTDSTALLVTYTTDRVIHVGDPGVTKGLLGVPHAFLSDSASVVEMVRDRLMGDSLFVRRAEELGWDKTPEFLNFRETTYRSVLGKEFRRRNVVEDVDVTEEEVRQKYASQRELYRAPRRVQVREIAVHDESLAHELLERIRAGDDMGQLAWQYSERPGAAPRRGLYEVGTTGDEQWSDLLPLFDEAEVGVLYGPVQADGLFSIYRVEERSESRYKTLDEVRDIVVHSVRREKADEAFQELAQALYEKRANEVTWYDDRIAAVAAEDVW